MQKANTRITLARVQAETGLGDDVLFPFVGWRACLPTCLPACFPASSSLSPSLSPSLSLACFPLRQVVSSSHILLMPCKYLVRTSSVKLPVRLEAWLAGLRMMSSFTFTVRCSIWQSYATWFECLDPNACTPSDVSFIVFWCFLAFSVATKQAKPKK